MTCLHCEKPAHSRTLCQMHYRRWRLYGNPLHKRRKRGVMDAPVTYPLGPAQEVIIRTLLENPGKSFAWYALAGSRPSVENAVKRIRQNFGKDIILTSWGRGYRMSPETALKLQKAVLR